MNDSAPAITNLLFLARVRAFVSEKMANRKKLGLALPVAYYGTSPVASALADIHRVRKRHKGMPRVGSTSARLYLRGWFKLGSSSRTSGVPRNKVTY